MVHMPKFKGLERHHGKIAMSSIIKIQQIYLKSPSGSKCWQFGV